MKRVNLKISVTATSEKQTEQAAASGDLKQVAASLFPGSGGKFESERLKNLQTSLVGIINKESDV
jgi:hypothetical protein